MNFECSIWMCRTWSIMNELTGGQIRFLKGSADRALLLFMTPSLENWACFKGGKGFQPACVRECTLKIRGAYLSGISSWICLFVLQWICCLDGLFHSLLRFKHIAAIDTFYFPWTGIKKCYILIQDLYRDLGLEKTYVYFYLAQWSVTCTSLKDSVLTEYFIYAQRDIKLANCGCNHVTSIALIWHH